MWPSAPLKSSLMDDKGITNVCGNTKKWSVWEVRSGFTIGSEDPPPLTSLTQHLFSRRFMITNISWTLYPSSTDTLIYKGFIVPCYCITFVSNCFTHPFFPIHSLDNSNNRGQTNGRTSGQLSFISGSNSDHVRSLSDLFLRYETAGNGFSVRGNKRRTEKTVGLIVSSFSSHWSSVRQSQVRQPHQSDVSVQWVLWSVHPLREIDLSLDSQDSHQHWYAIYWHPFIPTQS